MTNSNLFYTRSSIEQRISEIQAGTVKDVMQGETAPDGRLVSEINSHLYQQLEFLQAVLEQSVINFPVKLP